MQDCTENLLKKLPKKYHERVNKIEKIDYGWYELYLKNDWKYRGETNKTHTSSMTKVKEIIIEEVWQQRDNLKDTSIIVDTRLEDFIEQYTYRGIKNEIGIKLNDFYDVFWFQDESELQKFLDKQVFERFDGGELRSGWFDYTNKYGITQEYYISDVHRKIENKNCATIFINAIKELALNQDNLDNLENYLTKHFDIWMKIYADEPYKLANELKRFAEMENN